MGPTKYFSYWDWHSWVVLKDVANTANSYNNIHWDAPSADYEADETQNLSQLRYGSTGALIASNNCYLSTTGPYDYSGTCIKSWPRGTPINWQAWGSIRTCIAYAPTQDYDCYNLDVDASGISKSGWAYG